MSDDEDNHEEAIHKIKELIRDFPSVERDADIKLTLEKLAGHIDATDDIYPLLKKRLDGSGLDARHVKRIMQLSAATAKRINSTAKNFSLREKILRLKREHKADLARHLATEYAAGDIRFPPRFEFFYGALRLEGLVVKPRKKRQKIDLEQNATQSKATERDIRMDCEQDSTPKEVEAIHEKVQQRIRTSSGSADFLSAVVDPDSFPRTVENLFHFSFLVREGKVSLEKGESNKPVMKIAKATQSKRWNQSIMSFSMKDYEKWTNRR